MCECKCDVSFDVKITNINMDILIPTEKWYQCEQGTGLEIKYPWAIKHIYWD